MGRRCSFHPPRTPPRPGSRAVGPNSDRRKKLKARPEQQIRAAVVEPSPTVVFSLVSKWPNGMLGLLSFGIVSDWLSRTEETPGGAEKVTALIARCLKFGGPGSELLPIHSLSVF